MSVRVVNVSGMKGEARAGVVYCGRPFAGWPGHPLGNPFRVRPNDRNGDRGSVARTVDEALTRYREWVDRHPQRDALLAALWEETGHGAKPLGCWCVFAADGDGSPLVCHAQILASLLTERFAQPTEANRG